MWKFKDYIHLWFEFSFHIILGPWLGELLHKCVIHYKAGSRPGFDQFGSFECYS
ncbi:hypothetical protein SLEP1_g25090 [Rubroshorea leprosula]|uniref:Uncharacterized protein n=1 Tax=Rubroshorea leprosula TaxID=152421 RepID=A0AAV5JHU5_9ROSI|nr:hypothetical protein SLEP1_g25090 [Rubroshorea leprosula]